MNVVRRLSGTAAGALLALTAAAPAQPSSGAVVQEVDIGKSVFADGVTDPEALEHLQVQNLNRQRAAQLDNARQNVLAAEQEYQQVLAKSDAERRDYEAALARHRAEMEAWQRAVDATGAGRSR